jgi:hypothetical protein
VIIFVVYQTDAVPVFDEHLSDKNFEATGSNGKLIFPWE